MKVSLVLLAVLVAAVSTQGLNYMGPRNQPAPTMAPPIAVHDQDVLDAGVQKKTEEVKTVKLADLKEGDQIYVAGIGKRVYNPADFESKPNREGRHHPKEEHPMGMTGSVTERRPMNEREERMNHGMMGPRPGPMRFEGEPPRFEGMPPGMPPPPPFGHKEWERHIDANHMEGNRFHKKMRCMFIGTAISFTLVGLCLAKCCRKCRKNRREQVRAMVMRSRTANDIQEEIRNQERKLEELKAQYAQKRTQEEHARRQEEQARQAYEMEMRNRQMPQYEGRVYYAQPYPVQPQAYYNPRAHIPMGRPLNESTNSSFATEYPQL